MTNQELTRKQNELIFTMNASEIARVKAIVDYSTNTFLLHSALVFTAACLLHYFFK